MLALLIALCLGTVVVSAALATRARRVAPALLVLTVVLTPLACFAFLQTMARPTRSPLAFEVLGQFHPLGQSITFSDESTADVVLTRAAAAVLLRYEPAARAYTVRVQRSTEPVLWGGRPINAIALGRSSRITATGTPIVLRVQRPWWCWLQCAQHQVLGPDRGQTEVDLAEGASALNLDGRVVTLVRIRGRSFVSADPRAGVRVNGQPIPARVTARGDSLHLGRLGYGIATKTNQHRIDVLFNRSAGRERWDLPAELPGAARFLVAASNTDTVPGIAYVLNPAAAAPGGARSPYGGFIERNGSQWTWRHGGALQRIALDEPLLLPGQLDTRSSGHIVMLQRRDARPFFAMLAVAVVWLLGATLLAWLWQPLTGAPLAFRVATIGCLYTLVFVRAALAFRAWLAPPHNTRVIEVLLSLLIALPALIAAYHYWEEKRNPEGRKGGREEAGRREWRAVLTRYARVAGPVIVFVAVALISVFPFILPAWYGGVIVNVLATILVGTLGLAILQRLLIAPHLLPGLHGPFAVLDEAAARDYTYRHFITAVGALAFVGGMFALVAGAMQYGRLIAIASTAFVALALVWLDATFAPFVRPARPHVRVLFAAIGAATFGLGGWIAFSWPVALAAATLGGAIGWIAVERPRPRIRPFSLRQAIRPGLLAAASAALILLIATGLLSRVRVLVGYALAIAGMLVIVRIFTILWFRESDDAQRISTRQQAHAPRRLPTVLALAVVLVLTLLVYLPLGVTDPGLVLLFFSAATVTAVIGLSTVGARGALLGIGTLAAIVLAFMLAMSVRVSTLQRERPAALTTAETRYAAALHPQALQQHLVAANVDTGREILNTLQQDWGMQYHAALGGTLGRGYFGADFLERGVTTPVALAENSYSVFVLSEHGWLGGIAVLWVFMALVIVLLVAAAVVCDQPRLVPRALLLTGVAAFWAIPTLYMMAANASLLPLTGQNVPWLGLLSPADAALGAILAALALHALPRASRGQPGRALPLEARLRGVRKGIGVVALATVLLGLTLSAALWAPLHRAPEDFRLDSFLARVDELVQNRAILPGDSIAVANSAASLPAFAPGTFLTRTLRTSNALARGERPSSGYCYARDPLLRVTSAGDLNVTRSFCGLSTGSGSRYPWRGNLLAGRGGEDMVLTDGRSTVVFAPDADTRAAVGIAGRCDTGIVLASSARVGCQRLGALIRFGSSALTFEPLDPASVQLNTKAANNVTLLQPGDFITGPDGAHFLVASVPRGAAAYARWENGAWRRIHHPHAGAWLQQLDQQMARALGTRARDDVNAGLTLDPALHDDLRAALQSACPRVSGATACSALLADPATGAILAFAEWQAVPASRESARFRALDANLRNHPPASAIKPIVGAAALHAYPRLRELEVEHRARSYLTVANLSIGDTLRALRRYPHARVPWTGFLGASDNLYAATIGLLAAAPSGRNQLPEMRGTGDASGLRVQGKPLIGSPTRRSDFDRSPFAQALEELYGVQTAGLPAPPHDARFWKDATDAGALRKGDDLQRISPEAVALQLDRVRNPRTLASFMIGGASNRWNNLALVQALSRLYTGTSVELHLLESIGDRRFVRAPRPVAALERVRPHIRAGMRATLHEPWGTAHTALHAAFDTSRVSWVAKTGTLAEPEWTGSVLLWAGERAAQREAVCPVAGILVIELRRTTNPDGKATGVFREQIAPLLKEHRGWGGRACVTA
jgi:hypothetical protein